MGQRGRDAMNPPSEITSQIWVGPAIESDADVKALMSKVNPTRIINCRIEFDDATLLGPAGLPTGPPFYLWDGIPDWTPEAAIGLEPIPDSFFKKGLDFWLPY